MTLPLGIWHEIYCKRLKLSLKAITQFLCYHENYCGKMPHTHELLKKINFVCAQLPSSVLLYDGTKGLAFQLEVRSIADMSATILSMFNLNKGICEIE